MKTNASQNPSAIARLIARNQRLEVFLAVGILLTAAPLSHGAINTPPGAPFWWNNHDSPFWSYHDQTGSGVTAGSTEESNNGEFRAILTLTTDTLVHVSLDLENGYSPDLYKRFYIWLEGTSGDSSPPIFTSLIADNNSVADSLLGPVEGLNVSLDPLTHIWQLSYGGTATPQPDRVVLNFDLPLDSTITHWAAGEQCLPLPVPEPATISMLALMGLLVLNRRLRR